MEVDGAEDAHAMEEAEEDEDREYESDVVDHYDEGDIWADGDSELEEEEPSEEEKFNAARRKVYEVDNIDVEVHSALREIYDVYASAVIVDEEEANEADREQEDTVRY